MKRNHARLSILSTQLGDPSLFFNLCESAKDCIDQVSIGSTVLNEVKVVQNIKTFNLPDEQANNSVIC